MRNSILFTFVATIRFVPWIYLVFTQLIQYQICRTAAKEPSRNRNKLKTFDPFILVTFSFDLSKSTPSP